MRRSTRPNERAGRDWVGAQPGVDTNLIGYLLLASERSTQAEQAFRRDPEWAAPLLWRRSLRNVLAVQVRTRRINLDHTLAVIRQAEELMHGREYSVASLAVLRLAAEIGCTAYDGDFYRYEFVALAQDLDAPLVTVDRQVLAAFTNRAVPLETFIM